MKKLWIASCLMLAAAFASAQRVVVVSNFAELKAALTAPNLKAGDVITSKDPATGVVAVIDFSAPCTIGTAGCVDEGGAGRKFQKIKSGSGTLCATAGCYVKDLRYRYGGLDLGTGWYLDGVEGDDELRIPYGYKDSSGSPFPMILLNGAPATNGPPCRITNSTFINNKNMIVSATSDINVGNCYMQDVVVGNGHYPSYIQNVTTNPMRTWRRVYFFDGRDREPPDGNAWTVHAYAQGVELANLRFENVVFENKRTGLGMANGDLGPRNIELIDSVAYRTSPGFRYVQPGDGIKVIGNDFFRAGVDMFAIVEKADLEVRNNRFFADAPGENLRIRINRDGVPATCLDSKAKIDGNTWLVMPNGSLNVDWRFGTCPATTSKTGTSGEAGSNFTKWKADLAWGGCANCEVNSTTVTAPPSTPQIRVWGANGRGMFTALLWATPGSWTASVPAAKFSTVVPIGSSYKIVPGRQGHFGAPVVSGTYQGGDVSAPVPDEFEAFLILPGGGSSGPTPTPTATASHTPSSTSTPSSSPTATPTFTPTPTATSTPTPTPVGPWSVPLDPAAAVLVAPVELTLGVVSAPTAEAGSATWLFDVQDDSTVYVWVQSWAGSSSDDSWYVSVDGGSEDIFDSIGNGPWGQFWKWQRLNGRGSPPTPLKVDPRTFALADGPHSIRFRGRENGSMIAKLYVTSDPNFVPTDGGPPPMPTETPTASRTATQTRTPTRTLTATPTATRTSTFTPSPTLTMTPSATRTPTSTPTLTPSNPPPTVCVTATPTPIP